MSMRLIDHRNDVKICLKLCIETSHFDVISLVDEGKDHGKLLSVCYLDL